MTEKLQTTERYSSTLELACAEMKARLEGAQERLRLCAGGVGPETAQSLAAAAAFERDKELERQKYLARHFRESDTQLLQER
jgi:hypothetical protein